MSIAVPTDIPFEDISHFVCPLCHSGILIAAADSWSRDQFEQHYECPRCGITPVRRVAYATNGATVHATDAGSIRIIDTHITWRHGEAEIPTPQQVWLREYHPTPEATPDAALANA